jgi:hypothetical protein
MAIQHILKVSNFVLFLSKQKCANLPIFKFFHNFCIEDRALILNSHVIHAHAFHT